MKLSRYLALLLCAIFLALPLVSCGSPEETTSPVTTDPPTTTEAWISDGLDPELNYEGEKVRVLARGDEWYYDEMSVTSEEVMNVIDQSVYDREAYVEERLGVDLTVEKRVIGTDYNALENLARTYFRAGTDAIDILASPSLQAANLTTEGVMWDLRQVENIDFSQPWYSQDFVDLATLKGITFFVAGDATLSYMRYAFCTFVNLELAANYGIPSIYKTVDDGKWTLDYLSTTVANIYDDLNDNGKKDEGDLYGFATSPKTGTDVFYSSFDLKMVAKNEDGELENVIDVDKFQSALAAICDLFYVNPGSITVKFIEGDLEYYKMITAFASDRYLFTNMRLISVESKEFMDMESNYGIIPTPKWNEDQTEYKTYVHDLYTVLGIIGTVPEEKLSMMGAFLEAFSCYSYNATRDVYFETALKGRYVRDHESRRMLDIIVESRYIDGGWIYNQRLDSFACTLRDLVEAKNSNWASTYNSKKGSLNANIKVLNHRFGYTANK